MLINYFSNYEHDAHTSKSIEDRVKDSIVVCVSHTIFPKS